MDSKEGTQQPHLVLAHKLFLLRYPNVQDIEKVLLKDEVFAAVKSDNMALLYETLLADSVLESDQGLLHKLKKGGNSNGAVLGYLLQAWVDGLGGVVPYCNH